uniref:Uncharacterized protein n=1 Tax=Romanomermis culicivorax TaxID=13658 RepID=A0A915L6E6_ROMCU
EVEALTAADLVLTVPAALQILGPEVAQQALEFIANGTICTTPVDKILLDGEPSSLAVDAIRHAVEQASWNAQPPAVVAASPSTSRTVAQMLAVIAQRQPVAAVTNLLTEVANAFGETLCTINDDVSIIEASPFRPATASQSPKIGVLREVHPCEGLVIDLPGTSGYRLTTTKKNETTQQTDTVHIGVYLQAPFVNSLYIVNWAFVTFMFLE